MHTKQIKYTVTEAPLLDRVYHHAAIAARRAALRGAPTALAPSSRAGPLLALDTTIQGGRAALRSTFDDAGPVAKPHAEEDVGVGEEALFERDDDELCTVEAGVEERANVLSVGQVECGVDLVEDVHQRRFELHQYHDQRQCDE